MSENKSVMIVGERASGGLSPITKELLGGGRLISDQGGGSLEIVFLGDEIEHVAQESFAFGANRVYLARSPLLKGYQPEAWLQVLEDLFRKVEPELVLMGQTSMGRDLAPRLACRLGTGLAMDCIRVDLDPDAGLIRMSRPVFGGKAVAVMSCRSRPHLATVRSKTMKAGDPDPSRKGEVVSFLAAIDDSRIKSRVVETVAEPTEGVALEEAKVVVGGGRGIGGKEGFQMLDDLAVLLRGATGASRPPCDSGWVSSSKQVGLTGKIVRPDLYVAVAISGSSQHMAGCQDSKTIIAINKDPEANIFSFSHYGVVGDYRKVLPSLLQRLREKMMI